jgi:hypothetical protein
MFEKYLDYNGLYVLCHVSFLCDEPFLKKFVAFSLAIFFVFHV